MNHDSDIECICDVGFESPECPACRMRREQVLNKPTSKPVTPYKPKRYNIDEHIYLLKNGYRL